ncbi:hypothetical protein FNYG_02918 [Fusarium nygamai]|uniref:Major facilitator superfamily (MFS) profile domain-containing protein n=1 Tax=Gibberella nygamai TaxID=42673 RepID=A0A2K0WN65_GIBNY|nr:hypothetical protein FNYG_02918 [Fusarium nygamai]
MDQKIHNSLNHVSYSPISEEGNISPLRPVSPVSFTGGSDDLTGRSHIPHFDPSDYYAKPSQTRHSFQSRFHEHEEQDIAMKALHQVDSDDDQQRLVESSRTNDSAHCGQSEKVSVQIVPLLQSRRRMIVFVGLALSWLARGAEDTIITTIAPSLAEKFDAIELIGWFHAAYLFPQATLAIGFGKLSTIVQIRPYGAAWSIIAVVGTTLCIAASSAQVFILGRALAGLGMAAMVPLAATMLGDITTPSERPVYFALIVGLEVMSLAIGSLLGGVLDTAGDYRWGFAVTLSIKVFAFLCAFPFYRQVSRPGMRLPFKTQLRQFDLVGFTVLFMAFLMTLLTPQMASQSAGGWGSSSTIICFISAVTLFGLFAMQQCLHHDPVYRFLPAGIFSRDVALILIMGFFVVFAMYTTVSFLSIFYQVVHGRTSFQASVALLGYLLPVGSFSLITAAALKFTPWANPIILVGTGLATLGTFLLTTPNQDSPIAQVAGLSSIAGAGFGNAQTLGIVFSQQWVADIALQPLMVSVALTVQLFGGSLGLVLGSSLLNNQIDSRLQEAFPQLSREVRSRILDELSHGGRESQLPSEAVKVIPRIAAQSTRVVFYMAGSAAAVGFLAALCLRWHRVRRSS